LLRVLLRVLLQMLLQMLLCVLRRMLCHVLWRVLLRGLGLLVVRKLLGLLLCLLLLLERRWKMRMLLRRRLKLLLLLVRVYLYLRLKQLVLRPTLLRDSRTLELSLLAQVLLAFLRGLLQMRHLLQHWMLRSWLLLPQLRVLLHGRVLQMHRHHWILRSLRRMLHRPLLVLVPRWLRLTHV
jgi:hypothetical protein